MSNVIPLPVRYAATEAVAEPPPQDDRQWAVHDVAAYLGVPVETLYAWRKRSYGPPGRRVGRYLRYEPAAVREWFLGLSTQRGE